MAKALEIIFTEHDEKKKTLIVRDIKAAMHHVVAHMYRDAEFPVVALKDDIPKLKTWAAAGIGFFHEVLFTLPLVIPGGAINSITVHDLDAEAGKNTELYWFHFKSNPDLFSRVLTALRRVEEEGISSTEAANDLRGDLKCRIDRTMWRANAEEFENYLKLMREFEKMMGNDPIIPKKGNATDLVVSFPDLAVARFEAVIEKVYGSAPAANAA